MWPRVRKRFARTETQHYAHPSTSTISSLSRLNLPSAAGEMQPKGRNVAPIPQKASTSAFFPNISVVLWRLNGRLAIPRSDCFLVRFRYSKPPGPVLGARNPMNGFSEPGCSHMASRMVCCLHFSVSCESLVDLEAVHKAGICKGAKNAPVAGRASGRALNTGTLPLLHDPCASRGLRS